MTEGTRSTLRAVTDSKTCGLNQGDINTVEREREVEREIQHIHTQSEREEGVPFLFSSPPFFLCYVSEPRRPAQGTQA